MQAGVGPLGDRRQRLFPGSEKTETRHPVEERARPNWRSHNESRNDLERAEDLPRDETATAAHGEEAGGRGDWGNGNHRVCAW